MTKKEKKKRRKIVALWKETGENKGGKGKGKKEVNEEVKREVK